MTAVWATIVASVLMLMWIAFLMVFWMLLIKPGVKFPSLSSYVNVFKRLTKSKPQILCGYHLTLEFRHSTLAVVDGKNCEVCKREGNNV